MEGKKKNEVGAFTSLDSSLLGHCGMLISLAKATLLSDNLLHTVSPLGLVIVPLLASSDLEIVTVYCCYQLQGPTPFLFLS